MPTTGAEPAAKSVDSGDVYFEKVAAELYHRAVLVDQGELNPVDLLEPHEEIEELVENQLE